MLTIFILCKLLFRIKPRRRPARTTRTARTTTRVITQTRPTVKSSEQMWREARRAEADRMRRRQAEDDLIHLGQVRRDMLAAYQTARIDGDSEKAIRKRIAYDEQMRRIEKRIEKATFEANH